ncbi:MAG: hypothetical protein BWY84_00488 [Candidatus Aerophobetes bacterium ADurb.Bin490]|nr:MAG: hypothetical protein BWY84_00488 [Candidatus Aerophobetes bacterium ADurb.Bin490]HPI03172.1 hypothetical protein [Candidatus Goldiibacteriota bacterium]HPN64267.1 hypothetical protein [Candidatus Goldiibacteriota bacterium]HRQ43722.1 hypothetical protein [Candidatus Goldiibacteriota bacterium]
MDSETKGKETGSSNGGLTAKVIIAAVVAAAAVLLVALNLSLFSFNGIKFTDDEKNKVSYSAIDFTPVDLMEKSAGIYFKNIFSGEKHNFGKWAKSLSGYLFKYSGEKYARFELYYMDLEKYSRKDIQLKVYANGKLVYLYDVTGADGIRIFDVPLNEVSGKTLTLAVVSNASLGKVFDEKVRAVFVRKIGLH